MPDPTKTTIVLKAISDPIRWEIVRQMAEVDELACQTLEKRLPISKPTISYHIRILAQAGLVKIRKEGRYFFYTFQRQALREVVEELWLMAPPLDIKTSAGITGKEPADLSARGKHPVMAIW